MSLPTTTKTYGRYQKAVLNDNAARLWDEAFSAPQTGTNNSTTATTSSMVRTRSAAAASKSTKPSHVTNRQSPSSADDGLLSPPDLMPSDSDDKQDQLPKNECISHRSSDDDEMPAPSSQSSTTSLNIRMTSALFVDNSPSSRKISPKRPRVADEFGSDDEDEEDEDEEADDETNGFINIMSGASSLKHKKALLELETSEREEFQTDFDYITSMLDASTTTRVKCLSIISLARKCVSVKFRQFIRSEKLLDKVLRNLSDAPNEPSLAICTSCLIYMMARDKHRIDVDVYILQLIFDIVKVETIGATDSSSVEFKEFANKVWSTLHEWSLKKMERNVKDFQFDITEQNLSASLLALESLVRIAGHRKTSSWIKDKLFTIGALQWFVLKVEQCVDTLLAHPDRYDQIELMEKYLTVLETCTYYHKNNQKYLTSHRNNVLIQSGGKFIIFAYRKVESNIDNRTIIDNYLNGLSRMARVLANLSEDNSLCCSKLGELPDFLEICLSSYTYLNPKYSADDHRMERSIILSTMLVNLVDRWTANRRKLATLKVPLFGGATISADKSVDGTILPALEALTQIFVKHNAQAHHFEEDDLRNHAKRATDGLQQRNSEPTEEELMKAVQDVLESASGNVENDLVACFSALLIACLMQSNEESIETVRSALPNRDLSTIVYQLERCLDLAKILQLETAISSITRITEAIEKLHDADVANKKRQQQSSDSI